MKKIINEHGDNDEKKLEVMQAKSKLETNYLFVSFYTTGRIIDFIKIFFLIILTMIFT